MKTLIFGGAIAAAVLLAGCSTPLPPGAEPGPHGTMAYEVQVEASAPGARIEVNGEDVGMAPVRIKIFGDPDGTFHDFGSYSYVVRALPITTNQFIQTRVFQTGHMMTPEDRIPQRIFFAMNEAPPVYGTPGYPPPVYYSPPVYVAPYPYWGPSFYYGPRYYHRHY